MKLYIKNEAVKTRHQIIVNKDGFNIYNPTEDIILADGWKEYIVSDIEQTDSKKSKAEIMQEIVIEQYNSRTDIPNNLALDRAIIIYDWDTYIGKPLKTGQCVVFGNNVYRVLQDISCVIDLYPPSINTASLYEVIEIVHTGTIEDPIPYIAPMEIFKDKYYTENNAKYLCTRNSEVILTHSLKDLIGIYVEII